MARTGPIIGQAMAGLARLEITPLDLYTKIYNTIYIKYQETTDLTIYHWIVCLI